MPSFSFALLNPGNIYPKYEKPGPSLTNAFTKFFIKPSFICKYGKMRPSGSIRVLERTLLFLSTKVSLLGHSRFV
jgi:hypothetical protein